MPYKIKIHFVGKLSGPWNEHAPGTLLAGNWKFEQWYLFKTPPAPFVVDKNEMIVQSDDLIKLPKISITSDNSKALQDVIMRVFPYYGFELTEEYKTRCQHYQHNAMISCTLPRNHEGPHCNINAGERWNDNYGVYIKDREDWRKYLVRHQKYWEEKRAKMTKEEQDQYLERSFIKLNENLRTKLVRH